MRIERTWAMPSAWTFSIPPIKALLARYIHLEGWVDPFCGKHSPAELRNDLNADNEHAQTHMDAIDFLKGLDTDCFDGVLLDPPYSLRQVSEHYKAAGIKVTGWHTSMANTAGVKDEAARVLKQGGVAISFGWSSMGLGINRGFEMLEILLVAHGGGKNDTICTVERKLPPELRPSFNPDLFD